MAGISPQVFWPYLAGIVLLIVGTAQLIRGLIPFSMARLLFALPPLFFAIPMAVFGAEHLVSAHFVMNLVPKWMPARLFWAYFVGLCLIAAALSLALRIRLRLSATLLGCMILCFVLMIHLPGALAKPGDRLLWTIALRDSAFACGAFLIAISDATVSPRTARAATVILWFPAAVAVFFGIEHFLHPECVPGVPLEKLTPPWMPLGHTWTYLTGVVLFAGGFALLLNRYRRWSAIVMGFAVLAGVLFFYLPIMIAKPDIESLNYFTDTLVFAGVLLAIARLRFLPLFQPVVQPPSRAESAPADLNRAAHTR